MAYRYAVCLLAGAIAASLTNLNMALPYLGTLAWGPLWVALVFSLDLAAVAIIEWAWE